MTKLIKKRQLSCYTFKGITNTKVYWIHCYVMCQLLFSISPIRTNTLPRLKSLQNPAKSQIMSKWIILSTRIWTNQCGDGEWLEQVTTGTFEGKEFTIPKNYHEILTSDYGDYMQLPPVEQEYLIMILNYGRLLKGLNDEIGIKKRLKNIVNFRRIEPMSERTLTLEEIKQVELDILKYLHDLLWTTSNQILYWFWNLTRSCTP